MTTAIDATPIEPTIPSESLPETLPIILSELKAILTEQLGLPIDALEIDDSVPLSEGGLGLDSIMLFELITLIEKKYDFTFGQDDLNGDSFRSLSSLGQHIHAMTRRPC